MIKFLFSIFVVKYYAQVSAVPLVLFVVERLSRDPSRDVREFVACLQVSIAELELKIVSHDNDDDDKNDNYSQRGHSHSFPAAVVAASGTGFATFSRPPSRSAQISYHG